MNDESVHLTRPGERLRFYCGDGLRWEEVPEDTRVVYPPSPLAHIVNLREAAGKAIENPFGCAPLSAQLFPDMKVTIAFDDISVPLPSVSAPDPRQVIIELLLDILAEHGVTDVHLIAATGLRRRMTPAELRLLLGRRIFEEYYPDRLYSHDAEDKEGNQYLGKTDNDETVELNHRAVTSDLLIFVTVNFSSMHGGHSSVQTGLMTYRSARFHHNVECLLSSGSYMDPERSEFHSILKRMGELTDRNVNIFHVETTLSTRLFPPALAFLQKREQDYSVVDRVGLQGLRAVLGVLPRAAAVSLAKRRRGCYGVTSVQAGRTDEVHEQTLAHLRCQQLVRVTGQSDILIAGIPNLGPYNVNSIMNPVLVVNMAAGFLFNLCVGKPIVRRGGVLIVMHPLRREFDRDTHPSYVDFFDHILTDVREPYLVENHEEEFACNERYIEAYSHGYAYHGVHPFYAWYWASHGMEYLSRIIVVGARDAAVTERIGWDRARTLSQALEMARTSLNKTDPSLTVFHWPPLFLCEMT